MTERPGRPRRLIRTTRRTRIASTAAVAAIAAATALAAPTAPAVAAQSSSTGVPAAVWRYAPFVYLAPGERYRPMSADYFVRESSLNWAHDFCPDHQVVKRTHIDAGRLGSGGYTHQIADDLCIDHGAQHKSNELTRPYQGGKTIPLAEGFYLNLPNGMRGGQGTSAPVYYEYVPHRYVTYWFFYGFNDTPDKYVPGETVGDHEGDWEGMSVRLDDQDRAVTVAYFEHAGSCTLDWSQAGKHHGHPLGYSAKGTHATYPYAGTYPIPQGYGVQDVAGRGTGWATYLHLQKAKVRGNWYGYGGAWGEVGSPVNRYINFDTTGPLGPSPYKSPTPKSWDNPCHRP